MYKRITEDFDVAFPDYAIILKKYQSKIEEAGIPTTGAQMRAMSGVGPAFSASASRKGSMEMLRPRPPHTAMHLSRETTPDRMNQSGASFYLSTKHVAGSTKGFDDVRSAMTRPSTSGEESRIMLRGYSSQAQRRNYFKKGGGP